MSTIITTDSAGRKKMMIYAPDCRTMATRVDLDDWVIEICGYSETPFIIGVRFLGCSIIAENMRAFVDCYFDDDCEFLVKDFPVIEIGMAAQAINGNRVLRGVKEA